MKRRCIVEATRFSARAIKDQPPHTPLDPEAAAFYAQFIDAAYEMFERNKADLTPPQPKRFPSGYHVRAWIDMADFAFFGEQIKQFYGFIATETDDPYSHVIALCGTMGWWEWYDDAFFYPRRFDPVPQAGRVHYGFYRIYHTMEVRPAALDAAIRFAGRRTFAEQVSASLVGFEPRGAGEERKHHVIVTGHSLGAALATLYVMEHAIRKSTSEEEERHGEQRVVIERVCTFASPRVALKVFTDQYRTLTIDSWRIANAEDLMPKVPPRLPIPFQHVGESYVFSSEGEVRADPRCWHAMRTYEHWLEPKIAVDRWCRAR